MSVQLDPRANEQTRTISGSETSGSLASSFRTADSGRRSETGTSGTSSGGGVNARRPSRLRSKMVNVSLTPPPSPAGQ